MTTHARILTWDENSCGPALWIPSLGPRSFIRSCSGSRQTESESAQFLRKLLSWPQVRPGVLCVVLAPAPGWANSYAPQSFVYELEMPATRHRE